MDIVCDDRWITVKPNGKYNEGRPVKLGDGGEIKAGLGGRFNGQKIGEIGKKSKKKQEAEVKAVSSLEQFRRDAAERQAKSAAEQQAKHEEFISFSPKKQARLKLKEFHDCFQAAARGDKDYAFDPISPKALNIFARFMTRKIEDTENPQQISKTRFFDIKEWRYGDFKQSERDGLLEGGLIEEIEDSWDYKFTKAGKMLARALYADPPDFTKQKAQAAEREKKKEEARISKLMAKRVGRTYLNVPYQERWAAKRHGARWDRDIKKWYLPEGKEIHEDIKKYAIDEGLAMDRSMRSFDRNGHLIVERTIITKAAVNQYFGREVPNYESLGLEPEKIYNLLRAPEELKKALQSFKGVQLLIKHTPVSADDPHNDLTVGSVGTDIEVEGNDVYASLRVFDKYAIELIESGKLQELSAGYSYTADMTPGEFNGLPYDGVMRNIHGNHVALVERGRIGRDAIISDSLPIEFFKKKEDSMKLKKGAVSAIAKKLKEVIAMDDDITPEVVEGVVKTVADNMLSPAPTQKVEDDDEDVYGEDEDEDEDVIEDEDEDESIEEEAEDEEGDCKAKPAMDADAIRAAAVKSVNALWQAREDVKPLVGVVAMDSAEDVYKYALQQKGISTKGVHPSAYKSMVGLLNSSHAAPKVAMDSALNFEEDALTARFKI